MGGRKCVADGKVAATLDGSNPSNIAYVWMLTLVEMPSACKVTCIDISIVPAGRLTDARAFWQLPSGVGRRDSWTKIL